MKSVSYVASEERKIEADKHGFGWELQEGVPVNNIGKINKNITFHIVYPLILTRHDFSHPYEEYNI